MSEQTNPTQDERDRDGNEGQVSEATGAAAGPELEGSGADAVPDKTTGTAAKGDLNQPAE